MAALDTNVLVRLLVQDDATQCDQARALIEAQVQRGEVLYVPVTVVLELEWVLRSRYRFAKAQVVQALAGLLAAAELSLGDETAIEIALSLYGVGRADFADCVHLALAHQAGATPWCTFDEAAAKLPGAEWVS